MAYCSIAFGALDTLRRITKRRSDIEDKLWQAADECFKSYVARFLKDCETTYCMAPLSYHSGSYPFSLQAPLDQ